MAFQRWQKMAIKPSKQPFDMSILESPDPLASNLSFDRLYNPRQPYPSNKYSINNLYKGRSSEIKEMPNAQRNKFSLQNADYTIYTTATFNDAPDGVYVWIYSTEHGLYALRVYSKAEIGTKHLAITSRVRKTLGIEILRFKYAGELLKSGKTITINLLSGTFMADYINTLLERYTISLEELNSILLEKTRDTLKSVLPEFEVIVSSTPMNTFITHNVSNSEHNMLLERGFRLTKRNVGGSLRKRRKSRRRLRR